jgi:hypothetical protein
VCLLAAVARDGAFVTSLNALSTLHDAKVARMTPSVLAAEKGRTIHRYGPNAFAEVHIAEIAAAARGEVI